MNSATVSFKSRFSSIREVLCRNKNGPKLITTDSSLPCRTTDAIMASAHADQPPRPAQAPPPPMALPDLPPISSLFLIEFDVKAGYTILWRQALPRLEVEGVVEYKSLPSGLHTVAEDLVYFVHDSGHAGLSAFVNRPTDEDARRHARMIAVGVLVPLSYGRLGRAWRHAEGLKAMAAYVMPMPMA